MLKLEDFSRHDERVRGFFYGYNNQFGPARDFLGNKEFIKGWNEAFTCASMRSGPLPLRSCADENVHGRALARRIPAACPRPPRDDANPARAEARHPSVHLDPLRARPFQNSGVNISHYRTFGR